MPSRALARGPDHDGGQQHASILLLTCMTMTNKSQINLNPGVTATTPTAKNRLTFISCLLLPLPYLALMAPKSNKLSIQSFFGIQGQGRTSQSKTRPSSQAAQPAQEGLPTAQQERGAGQQEEEQQQHKRAKKGASG